MQRAPTKAAAAALETGPGRGPWAPVTIPFYRGPVEHYANAVRAEPGLCWRMVSRGPGFRVGSPTDCPEPVRWMGRAMVGKRWMRLFSCDGHLEDLEDVRPVLKESFPGLGVFPAV